MWFGTLHALETSTPLGIAVSLLAVVAPPACVCRLGDRDCGDGVLDRGEECDGANLGAACAPLDGVATCRADCTLETSACAPCGDGWARAVQATAVDTSTR